LLMQKLNQTSDEETEIKVYNRVTESRVVLSGRHSGITRL